MIDRSIYIDAWSAWRVVFYLLFKWVFVLFLFLDRFHHRVVRYLRVCVFTVVLLVLKPSVLCLFITSDVRPFFSNIVKCVSGGVELAFATSKGNDTRISVRPVISRMRTIASARLMSSDKQHVWQAKHSIKQSRLNHFTANTLNILHVLTMSVSYIYIYIYILHVIILKSCLVIGLV